MLGTGYTGDDVGATGREILQTEKDFNTRAGITAAADRPPEFMRYEKLPPHNHVFDITDEELDSFWS